MLKVFDGFIAAVNTETKIPFYKESDGNYVAHVDFENGQGQDVLVFLDTDESGDNTINYYSKVCKVDQETIDLFKKALEMNVSLAYGALALMESSLVIHQSYFLQNLDPQRFIKSLLYVAAKASELKEVFDK